MKAFPCHMLTRAYTLGTPRWRILQSGLVTMQLGNAVLRARDEFGQALYAVDGRIDGLSEAAAAIIWAHWRANNRGVTTFYWSDPLRGPEADGAYETWVVRYDPATPPRLDPHTQGYSRWDAELTLLPVVPTTAVAMLAAWWTMDEGQAVLEVGDDEVLEVGTDEVLSLSDGTEVVDSSGHGHTGTSSQDIGTMGVEGLIGGALTFNGTSDYVDVADAADLRLTDGGTLAAWIKPTGLGESSEGRIIDKSAAVDAGAGYAFALASSNRLAFRVAGDGEWTMSTANAITLASWQHVAVSFNDYGRKLWVNGEDVTASGGALTRLPPSSTATLRIGNRAGATDRSFNGVTDDVRIYARPLCQQEVRALWNQGSGTAEEVIP